MKRVEDKEADFLRLMVPERSLIFDIGANKGDYTNYYLRLGAHVISVEPDQENVAVLKSRFFWNKRVCIVNKAISDKKGEDQIFILKSGSGLNTMSRKWVESLQDPSINRWHKEHVFENSYTIQTTTLSDLISVYGKPFFIKVDVEGYEYNVIKTLNEKIQLLNLEANLPEFLEETILSIQHLIGVWSDYEFNICNNCKFVFEVWKNGQDFCDLIRSTEGRYLDIWVRGNGNRQNAIREEKK